MIIDICSATRGSLTRDEIIKEKESGAILDYKFILVQKLVIARQLLDGGGARN